MIRKYREGLEQKWIEGTTIWGIGGWSWACERLK